ncbi:cytochrome b5 [Cylindrobasidium torrendii FP15055 ss-10]|uniref:Cytochrome b5 n=1 Tax=Cylindrobasidium torrendii FP15055 ss-10 TaxID=1314674 RepID=A0A0D7BUN4_9AGAR|nr:cytochrome b5 [Cylindrobasidium torrendii FP15055 ss-10]
MSRVITYDELKAHTQKEDLYILIDAKVYNVSKFLDEHPGGDEVIIGESGHDATDAFEDVGHSDEARALLDGLYIGDFDKDSGLEIKSSTASAQASRLASAQAQQSSSNTLYLVPLAFLGGYFAWRYYTAV